MKDKRIEKTVKVLHCRVVGKRVGPGAADLPGKFFVACEVPEIRDSTRVITLLPQKPHCKFTGCSQRHSSSGCTRGPSSGLRQGPSFCRAPPAAESTSPGLFFPPLPSGFTHLGITVI